MSALSNCHVTGQRTLLFLVSLEHDQLHFVLLLTSREKGKKDGLIINILDSGLCL